MIMYCSYDQGMSKKEEMNWDKPPHYRWRKTYRGVKIPPVPAKQLLDEAGIVADHKVKENTRILANRYFHREKERIDAMLALQKFNPNHADYIAHRDSMQKTLESLIATNDESKKPIIAEIKNRIAKIGQLLNESTVSGKPPLSIPLTLRNPLNVTEQEIDVIAKEKALGMILKELEGEYITYEHIPCWLKSQGYIDHSSDDFDEFAEEHGLNSISGKEERERTVFEAIEKENFRRMKEKAEKSFEKKNLFFVETKNKNSAMSDFDRGRIIGEIAAAPSMPTKQEFRLYYQIDRYLEWHYERFQMGEVKDVSFDKLSRTTEEFRKWSKNCHIRELEAKEIPLAYHSYLRKQVVLHVESKKAKGITGGTARERMYFFKRFVTWLQENDLIGNISKVYYSKTLLKFFVEPSIADPIPLADVMKIYDAAPDRLKLCVLLMLNCGYGAAEIGSLKKSEVDFDTGRIVRRRGKTRRHENTPLVSYKLWDRTLVLLKQEHTNSVELLKQNWSLREQIWDYSEVEPLVLLNNNCSPLWHCRINEETKKSQRTDCVRNAWNDLLAKLGMVKNAVREKSNNIDSEKKDKTPIYSFYQLRDTAASLLGNSKDVKAGIDFSMDTFLFLGHAPKTTAEKHYVKPGENRIDDALEWLEGQIFASE